MLRHSPRSAFASVVSLLAMGAAAAYGCGGGDGSSSGEPGGDAAAQGDGTVTPDDGAVVRPDGAVTDGGTRDAQSDGDAAADAGQDAYVGPPVLSPAFVDYGINHVIMTGQSNATPDESATMRVATVYANKMFDDGPQVGASPTSFVALASGNGGSTDNALADGATKLGLERFGFGAAGKPGQHEMLISNNARSGWTYWCLRKGGCNYQGGGQPWLDAMGQVAKGKDLATAANRTYVVRAVTSIHGESEHQSYFANDPEFPLPSTNGGPSVADYADALIEWQRDYETDVKAITGQAQPVPMFITQLSGWNNIRYSKVSQFQYLAHKRAPGKVVIIGASYPMQFFNDCRHYTNESDRKLGEYFAKVYSRVVFEGLPWEPVRPKTITRAANVITVKYYVPVPPLVIDTTNIVEAGSLPGEAGDLGKYGFDFLDDGTFIKVDSVVASGDTVTLTLASTPVGANKKLRYAQNQVPQTCQGTGSNTGSGPGARGNLRDSDATPSRYGFALHNWGIVFEEDVP